MKTQIPKFEIGTLGAEMNYYDTSVSIFRALHQQGNTDFPEDPLDTCEPLPSKSLVTRYDKAIERADFLGDRDSADPFEVTRPHFGNIDSEKRTCITNKQY